MIIVSELGDKTFFIAAIMAMRHPRQLVFCAAVAALAVMTIFSSLIGVAAKVIPQVIKLKHQIFYFVFLRTLPISLQQRCLPFLVLNYYMTVEKWRLKI